MKYQGCPPAGCQDIGIGKLEFLAKTHFLFGFLKVEPNGFPKTYQI